MMSTLKVDCPTCGDHQWIDVISHDDWYALYNERDSLRSELARVQKLLESAHVMRWREAIRVRDMEAILDKTVDDALSGMQVAAAFKQPGLAIDAIAAAGGIEPSTQSAAVRGEDSDE